MSDQDFFFDEEDEKPAKTAKSSGGKSGAAKPAAKAAPARTEAVAGGSFFERELNMGVASLLVVCALLVGLVAGILVGQARANSVLATVPAADVTGANGAGQSAPQLTQEQLNSGQLPAGHPAINGANGATAAPSAAATGGK